MHQPKDGCVAGLSKFQDVVNILSRRPQLQERLASELADAIMNDLSAHGVLYALHRLSCVCLLKELCSKIQGNYIRKPRRIS